MSDAGDLEAELSVEQLDDAWSALAAGERAEGFRMLRRQDQDDFFLNLSPLGQAHILLGLPEGQR
ncbi:MAG: magnesium transporter, partial [Myxococcales bacterium]